MINEGPTIFKKVGVSEKKLILRQIAANQIQVTLKGEEEEIFHLLPIQNEKDELLLCHHTEDSRGVVKAQNVLINFQMQDERYFLQSELYFNNEWVVLKIDGDLFQLQRRNNSRIDLPEDYPAVFILHHHGGKNYFLDMQVKDISAGGLKVELPDAIPEFAINDKIKGSLRLGVRRPMELDLEIRFVKKYELDGSILQTLGLQFLQVNPLLEGRLLNLMMDLQREIYLKYSS